MRFGHICVAGIEPVSGKHVRPVTKRHMDRTLLRSNGGVFEIGALVDLGNTRYEGRAPELEDHKFSPDQLRHIERLKPAAFWEWLTNTSAVDLRAIFGNALEERGRGCTVNLNCGESSLGNFQPPNISFFGLNAQGKLRIAISDGKFRPDLSVTDVRFYEQDHETPRREVIQFVADRLKKGRVILSVGLSRAFLKGSESKARHWLQVNNIHLEEDPLGLTFPA
jgi:hypothetical protein